MKSYALRTKISKQTSDCSEPAGHHEESSLFELHISHHWLFCSAGKRYYNTFVLTAAYIDFNIFDVFFFPSVFCRLQICEGIVSVECYAFL